MLENRESGGAELVEKKKLQTDVKFMLRNKCCGNVVVKLTIY